MRQLQQRSIRNALALSFAAALLHGCGGGGGNDGGFQVASINVADGQVWQINRPIVIRFSHAVDPLSVNLNTLNVRQVGGGPVAGEFFLQDQGRSVVFQPLCPTLPDLSDAGLQAGTNASNNDLPFRYELNIVGVDKNSPLPVRSQSGDALSVSQTRRFNTPVSLNPLNLYLDAQVGAPRPLIKGDNLSQRVQTLLANDATLGDEQVYSYVEVGGPGGAQHFFRRFGAGVELEPPLLLPLNKLSDEASRVALILNFDQPVHPSAANVSSQRLRWEFASTVGATAEWTPLSTDVTLERNCGQIGARVRIAPSGVLPPAATLRAVVTSEFTDLIGENNSAAISDFAIAQTEPLPTQPPLLVDNVLESFDSSEHEDALASFAEPRAVWGPGGALTARFAFNGTGGPGGAFDWFIGAGESLVFNTTNSTITGGVLTVDHDPAFPNNPLAEPLTSFTPTNTLTVVGGVVDVRNFYIEEGATLKIEGPNPFVLLASGDVWIRGYVIASGNSSLGVVTLNTTNTPEPGAPGHAGGGRGGIGSPLASASTPRGGAGQGAFGVADGGGQGGETGWSQSGDFNRRRGAGGGGGRFGADVMYFGAPFPGSDLQVEQRRIGYDAEPGFAALQTDSGAFSGLAGPFGGAVGPSPFSDPDPDNNFFGTRFDETTGAITLGELARPWAGAGGGAGGDASRVAGGVFPGAWDPTGDEKGAGGGGGGGSLHVLALGSILFGDQGRLIARGGSGGGGENVPFGNNRVGGASGGGSGGHIVLETAGKLDLRAKAPVNVDNTNTIAFASPANEWAINALGGQGGGGAFDGGGAIQTGSGPRETTPTADGCPGPGQFPLSGPNACQAPTDGAGGDGGPGVIQFHTSNGSIGPSIANNDVLVAAGASLDRLCAPPPICPLGSNATSGPACRLVPTFGRTSRARSKWIALGDGGFDAASSTYGDVEFAFDGINTANGSVRTLGGDVEALPAALTTSGVQVGGSNTPYIALPGGRTLVLSAAALIGSDDEALLDNPALLQHYALELSDGGNSSQRYDVILASFDRATSRLALTVDGDGPSLLAFPGFGVNTTVALRRAYFRVRTNGVADALPSPANVQIRFQATSADPLTGQPDPNQATPLTADLASLNTLGNGELRFLRFEVLFDVGPIQPGQANIPIPSLEFLRLPFLYR